MLKTILPTNFFHLINTMYQDTKDKFHSISTFVKDTEKYVEDVKLNKDKYNNYWIKTIVVNNMSSSISFSGRAFSIPGRTSIKVAPTKVFLSWQYFIARNSFCWQFWQTRKSNETRKSIKKEKPYG